MNARRILRVLAAPLLLCASAGCAPQTTLVYGDSVPLRNRLLQARPRIIRRWTKRPATWWPRRYRTWALAVGVFALVGAAACTPVPTTKTLVTKAFRLHYSTTSTAPKPLVVILGATGRTQAQIVVLQNQDAYAEQQGYVAAYVEAPSAVNTWWTGPNSSAVRPYDGVSYLVQQVRTIEAMVPIDSRRVYIEGWSNGGFMAVHTITTRPDVFKAAGEIEAVLDLPSATTVPVRVKHIHASGDIVVPIHGGNSGLLAAAFGHPVNLPDSYKELSRLPAGSTDSLTVDAGSGPGLHDYQPAAASIFWTFFRGGIL